MLLIIDVIQGFFLKSGLDQLVGMWNTVKV